MTTQSKASTATIKPKNARVKELAVARLEALEKKQGLRYGSLWTRTSPRTSASSREDQVSEMIARSEARRKKESAAKQIATLTDRMCFLALTAKRRSLKPAHETVWIHRMENRTGIRVEGFPRLRETNPAIRALGRAEALLVRLVWQWAKAEARKEMEAQELQEADARQ